MTPNLFAYLLGRGSSMAASSLLRATLLWQLWRLTQSEAMTGLLGVCMVIPGAGLALVGGVVADARDRRRVVQVAQSVSVLLSVCLCVLSVNDAVSAPVIYVIAAGLAAAGAFENPSRGALLAQVVSREGLARAVTWASTVQALSFASGPAIAGVIIANTRVAVAYGTHASLLLLSVLSLLAVKIVVSATPRAASWAAVREGIDFVRRSPVLLGCMGLDLVAVMLGGASALLPVYAEEILKVGADGYGVLAGALEAGALVMSVILLRLPSLRRAGLALIAAVVVYGLCTIGFGLSTIFPFSVGLYALCGAADQISVVTRQAAVQLSTPDELRGRVGAVNMIFIICSNQLSIVESGFVAALIGAQAAVVIGGVGVVVCAVVVAVAVPALRRFDLSDARL